MREWSAARIGDVAECLDAIRKPVRAADRRDGPYPYYGASGVIDHVDHYLFEGTFALVAEDGENLRSRNTPVSFLATGKFWVNNHAHILSGTDRCDVRFLSYAIENSDMSGYLTGSTQPKLTQQSLLSMRFHWPPIAEQRAIAEVLGALDDKIEANRCVIGAANAVLDAIFWAHAVDSESTTASEVVDPILGGTPSRANPDYWSGSIPWASAKDVAAASDGVLLGTAESISERGLAESPAKLVGEGVSIITARGTVGRLVRTALPSTSFNQTCYALVPRGDLPPLLLYLGMKRALDRLSGLTHGTIFSTITKQTFDVLPINLPADDEWRRLSAQLESTDRLVIALLVENERLTRIRDALLPKLMSGELRVRDAERLVEDAV
jgi:type I restriction enzyme S subunit